MQGCASRKIGLLSSGVSRHFLRCFRATPSLPACPAATFPGMLEPLVVQLKQTGVTQERVPYLALPNAVLRKTSEADRFGNPLSVLVSWSVTHLLPRGYPTSVHPMYLKYSGWSAVSNLFGSVTGVLSMEALLTAVGVGNSNVLPLAAALSWILREGVGQVGGIFYAARVGRFDASPRGTSFTSTWVLSASTLLELLTLLAPQCFLLLGSVANVGKNVSCVASSASRAAINQSFARYDNLADVTAKCASQSIVACTVGTGLGCVVLPWVASSTASTLASFCALTAVQLYTAYLSLRAVTFRTLNPNRLALVLFTHWSACPTGDSSASSPALLSPTQCSRAESFVVPPRVARWASLGWTWLRAVGGGRACATSAGSFVHPQALPEVNPDLGSLQLTGRQLSQLCAEFSGENFLVVAADLPKSGVSLLVLQEASSADVFRGFVLALRVLFEQHHPARGGPSGAQARARAYCHAQYDTLQAGLASQGWDVTTHFLEPDRNRLTLSHRIADVMPAAMPCSAPRE
eukprot:RCo029395